MNGKDLLMGLGNISHKYYEEGENATPNQTRKSGSFRRHLLVAAVIALTLLLVGCAVAYVLRLQDMSIGQETYTQTFDDQGLAIEPTEKTRDIITIYGQCAGEETYTSIFGETITLPRINIMYYELVSE